MIHNWSKILIMLALTTLSCEQDKESEDGISGNTVYFEIIHILYDKAVDKYDCHSFFITSHGVNIEARVRIINKTDIELLYLEIPIAARQDSLIPSCIVLNSKGNKIKFSPQENPYIYKIKIPKDSSKIISLDIGFVERSTLRESLVRSEFLTKMDFEFIPYKILPDSVSYTTRFDKNFRVKYRLSGKIDIDENQDDFENILDYY